jgi:hypothetical protein|tara:strand:- start:1406 stop:1618 length:213 start_codon:yes stop_codon:yes gene_type:complete
LISSRFIFVRYTLSWISQQLAIPFWAVGHLHLSLKMDVYEDIHMIIASLGMNILVAIGFFLDYQDYKKSH